MHAFDDRRSFQPDQQYRLLPFRFGPFDEQRYILTNEVGEYVLLKRGELTAFVERKLSVASSAYRDLKARHFLFDDKSRSALDLLALKYRNRAETLRDSTGLHIFVATLRCDHTCRYCQVSRQTEDQTAFDMSLAHAEKALALTFRSPSPSIKIEFQGGEPLLNFPLIEFVVERATTMNATARRNLQFVIASNLSRLSAEHLAFAKKHDIHFSTSLDGPADLHDAQRTLRGGGSHRLAVEGIAAVRSELGPDRVSALMTTTEASLGRVDEIIDEYVRLGFHSVFLRSMSPFGFAVRKSLVNRYGIDAWLEFYRRGLAHVLEINRKGYPLREEFTGILLQKLFSPLGTTYVDLQSPAGIGIGALVYNYDGAVYASDEGRMLAEMGDLSYRLGHLDTDDYEAVMMSERLQAPLADSMTEGAPMCADCPYQPLCGSDPVFHQATQGDAVGHKAFSAFCKKQMGTLRHVIGLLEDSQTARDILMGWV